MHWIDLAILVAYIAGCTALGAWLGSGVRGLSGYFLGERAVPAWAVMISIVATETSTMTFLSIPGTSFKPGGNFTYLQLALGYVLGRIVVAALLLPAYFRGEIFTAYQVLQARFGGATRTTASVVFLVTRTLGDGLRLYLAALVLREMTDWPIAVSIPLMAVATIVYTFLGGMRAVIWTDVIQFAIYMIGAVAALGVMIGGISGGWTGLVSVGESAGKFRWIELSTDPTNPFTLWAGLIGGLFLNTATHGADQLMVQRYLSARSPRQAAGALIASGFIVLAQFALFLLIGVGLFAFYRGREQEQLEYDRAFGYFIVHGLPAGVTGLVVAALFSAAMSTLSSSLNASASATVNDLYRPLVPSAGERHLLRVSKVITAVWGLAQMGVAFGAERLGNRSLIDAALAIASFTTGILLGLFLLGTLTRRVGQAAALGGLIAGLLVVSYAAFGRSMADAIASRLDARWARALYPLDRPLAWPWYALVGSATVFAVGLLASLVMPQRPVAAPESKQGVLS
jgi:SSS family solute:Na+ symporter